MASNPENEGGRRGSWIAAGAAVAGLLLLLPLFAMQVTDEVVWDVADFAFFGALLVGTGVTYELAARKKATPRIEPPSALRSRQHSPSSG